MCPHKRYLKYFRSRTNVLDLGCGEGNFLELLKKENIEGEGVDINSSYVEKARKKNLKVTCADANEFLKGRGEIYDGIFACHVIEHFAPEKAVELVRNCSRALKLRGILVVVTPDSENFRTITHDFWIDLTHVRPYPLETLEKIFTDTGFRVIKKKKILNDANRFVLPWIYNFLRQIFFGRHWGTKELVIVGER